MPASLTNIPPIIYVLFFVAVFIVVQALAGMVFQKSDRTKRVNRRLTMLEAGMDPREVYNALVRRPTSPIPGFTMLTAPFEDFDRFQRRGAWERALKSLYTIPEDQTRRFIDGENGFIIPIERKRRSILSALASARRR